ncbi:hypothetical protein HanHA300_Chr04g0122261 [Helianthus annuus]|nr:hypothetical protein HanHA300_Chr04g0122261 [Helianthus annuus]KAJ0929903.1 hypothetical protein HanPSC8_Chr04g0143131 [Helianthus annuus]
MPEIWPEMLKDNDYLKEINDERSQLIVAARIKKDPQTGTYDPEKYKNISDLKIDELIDTEKKMIVDGTYGKGSEDPITKVFGREHGGRTRGVSSAIGHTKVKGPYFKGATKRVEVSTTVNMSQPRQPIDASPGLRGPSCGSGTSHVIYPDIQTVCQCELLYTFSKRSGDTPIAIGQAYPSSDRDLGNNIPMHEHCVKVLVDEVYSLYLGIPVLDEAFVEDKITRMEDTVLHLIQWPRKLIKILDARCDFNPSVEAYIPEMQPSPEVNVQFGSNDVYFGSNELYDDNVFLANSDALINTRMSAFEEDQTHHVEPQRVIKSVHYR